MDLQGKFSTTISVRAKASIDAYKTITYGDAVTASAKVDMNMAEQGTDGGTERAETTRIYTELDIAMSSLIWFAGESTTDTATGRRVRKKRHSSAIDGSQSLYRYDLE